MSLSDEAGFDELVWRVVDGALALVRDANGDWVLAEEPQFRTRAAEVLGGMSLSLAPDERDMVVAVAADDVYRFGPLTALMAEPGVTDILVNRFDRVFVDHGAGLAPSPVAFRSASHLHAFAIKHLARAGKTVNRADPVADADLRDGSRLHVVAPPVSEDGVTLAIRRFRPSMDLNQLVALGSVSPIDAEQLRTAVTARRNILVAGGPGAGKTTLMGALLGEVDPAQRIVGVEDVPELRPAHPQYVRLLTRKSNGPAVTSASARDLVREALRMRPDRLVIGEVRGVEALDMVSAMSTGMDGSMTTLHASSVDGAHARLATLLRLATGSDQGGELARDVIDLVVFVKRGEGGARTIDLAARGAR